MSNEKPFPDLTNKELGKALDLSPRQISKWRSGDEKVAALVKERIQADPDKFNQTLVHFLGIPAKDLPNNHPRK